MYVHLITAVVALAFNCHASGLWPHGRAPRQAECPVAEDISPCICTSYDDEFLDIDCSLVEDETQLQQVFQADFPSTVFRSFTMDNNQNVLMLEDGVFGSVTFKNLFIDHGVLEGMTEAALIGSSDTVNIISLRNNRIYNLPFGTMDSYTVMESLDLSENLLGELPALSSHSLKVLNIHSNSLGVLPVDTLHGLSNLTRFIAYNIALTDIIPGTFEGLVDLEILNLHSNSLWKLDGDTFSTSGRSLQYIDLHNNYITSVAPDAFPDMSQESSIDLGNNNITTLEEAVWRPLLEDHVQVFLQGNPLACGCDVAWVVGSDTLLGRLPRATCASGVALDLLHPEDFDQC
nr:oplophorus-luciferin 2-monooxygenase non-catalytic subunit-like [Procambarus clarkii]